MVSLSLARANRAMIVWSLFVSLCDRAWLLCAQQNSKKTQKKSATRTEPNHTGTMLLSNHTNTFEILITGDLIDKSTFFDASFKINWVNLFRFENTLNELFFSSSGNKRKKWRKFTNFRKSVALSFGSKLISYKKKKATVNCEMMAYCGKMTSF